MKRFMKLVIAGIFMFQIHSVYAEGCTDSQITNLKELANTIQVDVEFDRDSVAVGVYNNNIVTIQNLSDDLYMMSKDYSIGIFPEDVVDGVITKNLASSTDTFQVYSVTCPNTVLRTIKLSMKQYNEYVDYEECDGIDGDELDVCGEFYETNISYEQFVKKVNDYKNKQQSLSNQVKEGFEKYYPIVIGIGMLLIIFVVVFVVIKRKRGKLD